MSQIEIRSAKGTITGTIDECAAWLAEQQPAFPGLHYGPHHEELTVAGTPGRAGYRRAIEAALAEMGQVVDADGEILPAELATLRSDGRSL